MSDAPEASIPVFRYRFSAPSVADRGDGVLTNCAVGPIIVRYRRQRMAT